jgi:hypothetical protein
VQAGDVGQAVTCSVTATNVTDSTAATSNTVTPAVTYASTVLTDSPIRYWSLDEASGTVPAEIQGVNPGAYVGGVTLNQAGATSDGDAAIKLNGTTGEVTVPDNASLHVADVFTVEMWVNRNSGSASGPFFYAGGGGIKFTDSGGGVLYLEQAGAVAICTSTSDYGATGWHHIAVTKNGAAVHLYIDGVDRTGSVTNATLTSPWVTALIGAGQGFFYSGYIDEVAIYNTALTSARILAHFNAR